MTMRFVYCRSSSAGSALINDLTKGDRRKVRLPAVCLTSCHCRRKAIFAFIVKEHYEYLHFQLLFHIDICHGFLLLK